MRHPGSEGSRALDRRKVKRKPDTYQASKAEKEEEMAMPGADTETVRSAFFRPVEWEGSE